MSLEMGRQRFGRQVPDRNFSFAVACGQHFAICTYGHHANSSAGRVEEPSDLAAANVPRHNPIIDNARDCQRSAGADDYRRLDSLLGRQLLEQRALAPTPRPERTVLGDRHHDLGVRSHGDTQDASLVSTELADRLAGLDFPHPHGSITTTSSYA